MTDRKRPPVVLLIIPLMIAFAGLNRVTQSPSYHLYSTVDVVQLVGSGACFGAVLAGLISWLVRRRQIEQSTTN